MSIRSVIGALFTALVGPWVLVWAFSWVIMAAPLWVPFVAYHTHGIQGLVWGLIYSVVPGVLLYLDKWSYECRGRSIFPGPH